ncbi:MAG TPA: dihydrolipoamide acetyltransferase family protein [Gaiellaceae bacterium]|nr:dihydrolipoamide acetyltransferase family protein [Gaiellaceae bacterium]
MPTEVIMPMLGMAQETGKVLRWLKAEGEAVAKGEPLIEVETDKVTVEIEAPADGTLAAISAGEGVEVPVGQAIAFVLAPGESAPEPAAVAAAPVAAAANGTASTLPSDTVSQGTAVLPRRALASPKARRLAAERGVPIEEIRGSGPYGAVVAADVEAFDVTPPLRGLTPLEVSSVWKTMAGRMQASWRDVPHFYLQRDCDATRLGSWRHATRRRPGHERVTHTDLLVKLCAAALLEHPRVNASWRDGEIVGSDSVDVGVAVATDDALIVPVIHGADRLGLAELSARRAELVGRARERKLRPEDVAGGTFTISNLGMFGVDAFQAIVNAPQAAILAVGRILDRVVAVDGAPVVRPTLTLTLSFDHRVVDGAAGARFLDTLASLVEEPAGLVS